MSNTERKRAERAKNNAQYDEEIRAKWSEEQNQLKETLELSDRLSFNPETLEGLSLVGGVDISFFPDNTEDAVAGLVILAYPSMEVLLEIYQVVKLTLPYIASFLAFREVPHLVALWRELQASRPELTPQVIFVDGNGFLHPRGLGLASHLGVLIDVPTVGIGKNLLFVDGIGTKEAKALFKEECTSAGSHVALVGQSGTVWGAAFRSTEETTNPIYVSIGHRVCLETACRLTASLCQYRVPEPVRVADKGSRDWIRRHQQQQRNAGSLAE